jgi:small subunit ribosomal protein S8
MSLNDPLANVFSKMLNAEKVGKESIVTKPSSKFIARVLDIVKTHGYIRTYTIVTDGKGDMIKIDLIGHINKCGVIKPRMSYTLQEIEKFEKRFLPAEGFGMLIVSTSKGLMTHREAMEKKLGGRLIAYIY